MGSMMGDQVGSGGANRHLGGAQRMYGTERDTMLGRLRGRQGRVLIQSWVSCKRMGDEMAQTTCPLFFGGNETPRLARISVACTCALA